MRTLNVLRRRLLRVGTLLLKDYVLLYQMGKVGSSTIEVSLKGSRFNVIHVHSFGGLSSYHLQKNTLYNVLKNKIRAAFFKAIFRIRRKPIRIIVLMRDPVARNISALFQELPAMLYFDSKEDNRRNESTKAMLDRFLDQYVRWNTPFDWFDQEFKEFTGIDVFGYDFDKTKGSVSFKKEKFKVLLLTSEKIKNNQDTISQFLEHKIEFSQAANESKNKWYGAIYKDYLDKFCLDEPELTRIYNSKVVQYFYDPVDIKRMSDRWKC